MHHAYHATHSHADAQDMRNMGGLRRYMPWTFWLMTFATLAIAGVPPFAGFFSKDEILGAAFARGAENPLYYLYYGMGIIAAFITAFYMARLMAMTFLGENRTGEKEREHLHEAPWVMTGPLVILGILSVVGGTLNIPEILGGHAGLHHWLEPVFAPSLALSSTPEVSHSTEWILIGSSVLVGIVGLVLGYRATLARPTVPADQAVPDTGFARVLFHKYYVDELYDRFIVRPLVWLSEAVLWRKVDQGLVDGAGVNGTAGATRVLGRIGSFLQNGYVGAYVVAFLVGALWILISVVP